MSRGGRGGRGGGKGEKRGPDMSWDDEEVAEVTPNARKPRPLFPERYIPTPKPLSAQENSSIASFITIRDRMRRGPLYSILDPTTIQSQHIHNPAQSNRTPATSTTKPNPRAGFDPFTDQEKYTLKYHRKRRTYPDLTTRSGYTLKFFPLELWSTLDPKRRMQEWKNLSEDQLARVSGPGARGGKKRKREKPLKFDDVDEQPRDRDGSEASDGGSGKGSDDDEDEDPLSPSSKRKKRKDETGKKSTSRQKKGLDAEDEYPDVEPDEDGEGQGGDDEPADSEFGTDEEDDDGADDYNAEQYFDDGADEGDDAFGGGDGGDGEGYY